MHYQISFGGAASSDLTKLLSAVENQLNVGVMRLQLQAADAAPQSDNSSATPGGAASTGGEGKVSPIPDCICQDGKPPHNPNCICPDGKPPHNPNFILLVVVFAVGVAVGYVLRALMKRP